MNKRSNKFRITLEQLASSKEDPLLHESMQLIFVNHNALFTIIPKLQEKNPFQDQNQAAAFALGLKMFSGVML